MKIKTFAAIAFAIALIFPLASYAQGVTHEGWAAKLIKALPFDNSPGFDDENFEKSFKLLEKIPDKGASASSFVSRVNNPQIVQDRDGEMAVQVVEQSATVFYFLVVPARGESVLRARLKGGAQYWTFANEPTVITRHQVVANEVEIGRINFKRGGIKRLGVSIPKDGMVSGIKMDARGDSPIVPRGGWQRTKRTTNFDMAQTFIQALDWGYRLPPSKRIPRVEIVSKKKPAALGGLRGYVHGYNDFSVKEEGFYAFSSPAAYREARKFLVNGYMEKKVESSHGQDAMDGTMFVLYLKPGTYTMTCETKSERDPASVFMTALDSTCEAYREIFKEIEGFKMGECAQAVTEEDALANLKALEDELGDREKRERLVPGEPSDGDSKDGEIKRRSLSPVMPFTE